MRCKYLKFGYTFPFLCFVLVPVIISQRFPSAPSVPWRFQSSPLKFRDNNNDNERLGNLAPPVNFNSRVWNGNVVPYNISSITDDKDRRLIYGAIQEISNNTCYRFKPRWRNENLYLDFVRGYGCQVFPVEINRSGQKIETRQRISLPVYGNCLTHNKVSQLILSALGLGLSSSSLERLPQFECKW